MQHMTMVSTAYQTTQECPEETIVDILGSGFSGQLKGWWDNYLSDQDKTQIFTAIKTDDQNNPITSEGEPISDAVNTLIFTIV